MAWIAETSFAEKEIARVTSGQRDVPAIQVS
jgi:hypothetical protein